MAAYRDNVWRTYTIAAFSPAGPGRVVPMTVECLAPDLETAFTQARARFPRATHWTCLNSEPA